MFLKEKTGWPESINIFISFAGAFISYSASEINKFYTKRQNSRKQIDIRYNLNVSEIWVLNPVERQRKEIIILKLYLYIKPILIQDGERVNLVISRHNTFKANAV